MLFRTATRRGRNSMRTRGHARSVFSHLVSGRGRPRGPAGKTGLARGSAGVRVRGPGRRRKEVSRLASSPPSGPASPDEDEDIVGVHSPVRRKRRRPDVENDVYDPANDNNEVPAPMAKRTRRPRREVEEEVAEEDEEEEILDNEDGDFTEGDRQRYRNARVRRKDRFVTSIATALDPANYRPIPPPETERLYRVQMTADPINNEPASEITWTNIPPVQTSRRAAEDVVYKSEFFCFVFLCCQHLDVL
jgi:hypothetical protein